MTWKGRWGASSGIGHRCLRILCLRILCLRITFRDTLSRYAPPAQRYSSAHLPLKTGRGQQEKTRGKQRAGRGPPVGSRWGRPGAAERQGPAVMWRRRPLGDGAWRGRGGRTCCRALASSRVEYSRKQSIRTSRVLAQEDTVEMGRRGSAEPSDRR